MRSLVGALALLVGLVLTTSAAAQQAQQEYQPWTHPEVLKAAFDIGMTPEQRPQFQAAVTEMLREFNEDVQRLMKRHNQTGLPRKIASKRRARVKAMDEQMAAFLSEEQVLLYHTYRDKLLEKMDERAARLRRGAG